MKTVDDLERLIVAWTLILGGVFVVSTYSEVNMPIFDTTLMGLLGDGA